MMLSAGLAIGFTVQACAADQSLWKKHPRD